jgi:DNA-binding response OmpR family regulator
MKVLIVEDDASVARFLNQAMTEAGYTTQVSENGRVALDLALEGNFDLVLLDVMLPGMSGIEVCRSLRAAGIGSPVLILTAKDTLNDKIEGLDAGADDYIVKPFHVAELLARARAMLRRGQSSPTLLRVADLTLDPATRQANRNGKPIALSSTEYALLEYLMRHVGSVLTRSMILDHVWQYDFEGNDNVLEVYISYLRRKIDKGHVTPLIHTVRGAGYRMSES